MFKRRVLVALAAGGVATAIPFLPATMSSAGSTDDVCLVEPVAGPPDAAASPASVPPIDAPVDAAPPTTEPAVAVDIQVTPSTAAATDVEAAPTTEPTELIDVTPTTETAVEGDVTSTTEATDAVALAEVTIVTVDSLPDFMTSAGEGASGFRVQGRNVTAEPAPPPRQNIKFELQFVVNPDKSVELLLNLGSTPPDPCKLWPGSTLTTHPAIPGHYTITFPKLSGRNCDKKDVTVSYRGNSLPHSGDRGVDVTRDPHWAIIYNGKDEPQIVLRNIPAKDLHLSRLDITMKCTVPVPRK